MIFNFERKTTMLVLSIVLLTGCTTWSTGSVERNYQKRAIITKPTEPQKISLIEGDITDRKYFSLGNIYVTVNKATVFHADPTKEQVNEKLKEKAAALGADAVIFVRYGGVSRAGLSWGSLEGNGRAIKYQAEVERNKPERLAISEPPSVSVHKEIAKDERFIAYDNGTVMDIKTNLLWASEDNGININWADAKSYCENYRGGGYTDWRLPTLNELAGLYDASKSRPVACNRKYNIHVATELIDITCFAPWASETRGYAAAYFTFYDGYREWYRHSNDTRALPVRSVK